MQHRAGDEILHCPVDDRVELFACGPDVNAVRAYLAVPGTIRGVLVNESLKNTHANPIAMMITSIWLSTGTTNIWSLCWRLDCAETGEPHLRGSHYVIDVQSRNPCVLVREWS